MKIAILYSGYPPLEPGREDGGADYVQRFAEHLAACGHEVHVITSASRSRGPVEESEAPPGLFIHRVVSEWGLRGIWKGEFARVRRKLADISPEVINVVFPGAKLRSRYALPCLIKFIYPDAPLVPTLMHLMHPRSLANPVYLALLVMFYSASSKICFMVPKYMAIFQKLFPYLRRRCVYIPCGCNLRVTHEYSLPASRRMRERLNLSPEYRYVAFYGYWYPSKNVHVLVQAVARLIRKGAKIKLLLIGGRNKEHITSSYGRRVLGLLDDLNLWPSVVWTGRCSEGLLNDYLLSSEVCVLPFSGRTIGRSTLYQVMSLGVPLITTRTADSGFLRHKVNAFLLDRPTPEHIETAIIQLLRDEELCARLSQGAREASQEISWPRLIQRWEEMLNEVVSPRSPLEGSAR